MMQYLFLLLVPPWIFLCATLAHGYCKFCINLGFPRRVNYENLMQAIAFGLWMAGVLLLFVAFVVGTLFIIYLGLR